MSLLNRHSTLASAALGLVLGLTAVAGAQPAGAKPVLLVVRTRCHGGCLPVRAAVTREGAVYRAASGRRIDPWAQRRAADLADTLLVPPDSVAGLLAAVEALGFADFRRAYEPPCRGAATHLPVTELTLPEGRRAKSVRLDSQCRDVPDAVQRAFRLVEQFTGLRDWPQWTSR